MESTEFKLQERTALLTGPCTSIMQSIATTLTQLGCSVVMADSTVDTHQRFADRLTDAREIHDRYGRALALRADFTTLKGVRDMISQAAQAYGGIDIYVDGLIAFDTHSFRDETAMEDLDRLTTLNFKAPLMITQNVLKFLEGRKRGRVIFLMHDLMRMGLANQTVAAATRAGVVQLARSLARETLANKVTINCVAMGPTEELLLSHGRTMGPGNTQLSIQAAHAELLKKFPDASISDPEKVAQTVAFLVSSLGAGITGQTLAVSQGLSLQA
jgi:2-hydroxycyclohexanecarboxyl-CoA dehydrogenase